MSINHAITKDTPSRILFGSGVFFQGVEYSEAVAPTEEKILAGLLGATQEGGKITVTPTFSEPDLDGKKVSVLELIHKSGETAVMDTSMVEVTAEMIAKSLIGVIKESTDKNYDVVTSSSEIRKGHFLKGFGYYGELIDGRPFISLFKNALCTSGFGLEAKSNEYGKMAKTFECKSDIEYSVEKLPYAFFIRKKEGWTPVKPEEITETTAQSGS